MPRSRTITPPWATLFGMGVALLLPQTPVRAQSPDAAAGRHLMAQFQCNRCHEGTGLPAVPQEQHCVHCHTEILQGTFAVAPETLKTWQSHLVSLNAVPSLTAAASRLRRQWIASFLLHPHDLRPGLPALMPRLDITPRQAQQIAAALVPREAQGTPSAAGDPASGRLLLDSLGCGACHQFTGVPPLRNTTAGPPIPPNQLRTAMALAPDLRYTRERFQPAALIPWLRTPSQVKPDTQMPQHPISESQAQDLAAYILTTPLSAQPTPVPPARLPILSRRVSFDEVNERVFRRTCWHCHSTAAYAKGDGGPGNTGGFGFKGRGFSVTTYADVASGVLDNQGNRRSVFAKVPDGTPRLLAVLLTRHKELAGEQTPGLRGMPLGLPALSAEQIQLVESWIAQGRPQ